MESYSNGFLGHYLPKIEDYSNKIRICVLHVNFAVYLF